MVFLFLNPIHISKVPWHYINRKIQNSTARTAVNECVLCVKIWRLFHIHDRNYIFVYGRAECKTISLECTKVKFLILNNFETRRDDEKFIPRKNNLARRLQVHITLRVLSKSIYNQTHSRTE